MCSKVDQHDRILLCDGCENECHMHCLDPPLAEVPVGDWFCPACQGARSGAAGGSGEPAAALAAGTDAAAVTVPVVPAVPAAAAASSSPPSSLRTGA